MPWRYPLCGSDLWYYRGDSEFEPGPIGHEFIGVVEDVGAEVTGIKTGDLAISPFGNDRGVLLDVLTQLIPFIGYPRALNRLRVLGEVSTSQG